LRIVDGLLLEQGGLGWIEDSVSTLSVGFGSGSSGFDFTVIVLLLLPRPPGAYLREARELFSQAAQPSSVEAID
jgi:hypothetical protein